MKNTLTIHIDADNKAHALALLESIKEDADISVRRAIYSEQRKQEVVE